MRGAARRAPTRCRAWSRCARARAWRSCRRAATPAWSAARCPPARGARCVLSLGAHEPHPRARPAERHHDRRGGLRARRGAERRGRGRAPVSAFARRRGQLPDRRQPLDQRRRRQRAALRQRARAGARPRSGAARRPRLGRPARPAQGQHRLRPEAAFPRRRGHARHHHRRGAAAATRSPTATATAWIALDSPRAAVELLARCASALGERISRLRAGFARLPRSRARACPATRATRSARRIPGTCWRSSATAARPEALRERVAGAALGRAARRGARAKRRAVARALAHPREHPRGAVHQRQARHLGAGFAACPSSSSAPARR